MNEPSDHEAAARKLGRSLVSHLALGYKLSEDDWSELVRRIITFADSTDRAAVERCARRMAGHGGPAAYKRCLELFTQGQGDE